jgi:imidazolonepropionase-like amidohydrolase
LTPTGGHFHFCGGEADTPAELDAAVRTLVAEGADHIKLIASGGGTAGSAPHETTYDRDQLRTAVETAHELGRLTTAHCRSIESLRRAVAAGVDCVEHVDFLGPDATVAYDPAVAEQLSAAGTFLSMTMQAGGYDALVDTAAGVSAATADPGTAAGIGTTAGVGTTAGIGFTAGIGIGRSAAELARIRAYFDDKLATLARLLADGFAERIVISTDAGPSDTRFGRFGLGLALAVDAGMTPAQALTAATRTAAAACGIADRVGTLEPGRVADLLVVDGDPTVSIGDAARVHAVFVAGVRTA